MINRLAETFELRFDATRRQARIAAWTMLVALLVLLVAVSDYLIR